MKKQIVDGRYWIYKMSFLDTDRLITNFLFQFSGIEIYQNGLKNMFHFEKKDIFSFRDFKTEELKYKIIGTLYDKKFNLKLGEGYFFIKNIPYCCYISQINHAGEYRANYEAVIIIEVNMTHKELACLYCYGKK